MEPDALHLDRARATSFGSVAEQYDRHRPQPPDELIDDLMADRPARGLDVGCGTGKVARTLAGRGLAVLGVEVDERMADVARGHGVEVEVAPFETWDDAGRRFDLITCGDAWHWIDPEAGTAKAARVLAPGGLMAWFWNSSHMEEPMAAAFAEVYAQHAPEIVWVWGPRDTTRSERVPASARDAFTPIEEQVYRQERVLTADQWTGLVATSSDHLRLGPDRLAALLLVVGETIGSLGGHVHLHHETTTLLCRRRSG
ncbi:class I SAM-dependent methyltransferase [Nonomuraea fuscirosea]|uniref:class I SAM-dependent methyltransferase n=1 Tax=Nonomuraea fuscirosea TaxID=1291556 RepID=UPI002DD8733E|nr:class I SAM-dependent methyltransferase [Nonomuraea fuscirosea]WSA52756.1 class I SAM-dependent methyltransferase [Nonomuraea fuscirosea]